MPDPSPDWEPSCHSGITLREFPARTVKCDIDRDDPSRSERDQLLSVLRDRTIADQPDVGSEQIAMGGENLFEIDRPGFFFALKDEADIRMLAFRPCGAGMLAVKARSAWR